VHKYLAFALLHPLDELDHFVKIESSVRSLIVVDGDTHVHKRIGKEVYMLYRDRDRVRVRVYKVRGPQNDNR